MSPWYGTRVVFVYLPPPFPLDNTFSIQLFILNEVEEEVMGSEAATQFEQMQTRKAFFCKGLGTNAAMRYKYIHFIMLIELRIHCEASYDQYWVDSCQ